MKGLFALVVAALAAPTSAIAGAPPHVGGQAPAFVGRTIDGMPFDLSAQRGHVVIVNLWATWCPPCRAEMPMLDAVYRAHQKDGLIMIGLSADRRRDTDDVRRVMQAFSYPVALLSEASTNEFGRPAILPMTFVVGPDGKVLAAFTSDKLPLQREQLEQTIGAR